MAATAASTLAASVATTFVGTPVSSAKVSTSAKAVSFAVKAEKVESEVVSRRAAVSTLLAGIAALSVKPAPANAAYGEAANVFGAVKTNTDYLPFKGDGYSFDVPAKFNPSRTYEFAGTEVKYEDNFDALTAVAVIVLPTSKSSITDYGSPEKFINEFSYLLGTQVFSGETSSEGGFAPNATVSASVLTSDVVENKGKTYYKLNILTRTADGQEGGRHQLFNASISNGKLYIMKAESGDKRWFKGAKKFVEGAWDSFTVV